ncbi:shikimate 5-dehydrogenase [Candidatus Fukatsuia symbiotica]|uniref:shikimate 5-dehydrogenase n=1 Tax=Candidatus Fukatsuia TaxID=1927833 RepID=UPI000933480A|nr:shikimate 5-dehydrogenase [Candidatus Fukatsuia symbiotica]MEA9444799.1 shikimate 5-dehydrogenase [Candidatus Fukatsuia symbiotica]
MNTNINKDTQLCISLAGNPGNFGTRFHNFLYEKLALNYIYKAFTTTDIEAAVNGIRALGIRGCAVSMPFKESCIPFLDQLDNSAKAIGSVNTIVNNNGCLHGYNTDYIAVVELLKKHQIPTETSFILQGSGGMAKAVTAALRDSGFRRGHIVARNQSTGKTLAQHYNYQWQPEVGALTAEMLINATPMGMATSTTATSLAFTELTMKNAQTIFDVVANETPLLSYAGQHNKRIISGSEVIAIQAREQFALYTGVRPSDLFVDQATAHAQKLA